MGRRRRAYLDTFVLISIIIGDKHFLDMQKALYDLIRRNYEIVVPQIAVGEALAVLMRRYPDPTELGHRIRDMALMFGEYRISVEGCVAPAADGSHAIAVRLHGMDERIAGNDLAITAQALADPDSAVLLTRDSVLLYSGAIRECEAGLHGGSGGRNQRMVVIQRSP